jgi:hypothetical protein
MNSTNHHNHARYKTTEDGRFVMWRNLHFGTYGNAGSEYLVTDSEGEFKTFTADNQMMCECYVQFRMNNKEFGPYFGNLARDGKVNGEKKLFNVTLKEWKSIKLGEA